jgi:RimJ/RimL family protein N-acetyltransferase
MIYGEGMRLRAIEPSDVPNFVRWLNDPETRRFLLLFKPLSTADEERWVEGLAGRSDYVFAFEALIEDRWVPLGNVGLHDIDWKNRSAMFGIFLGEKQYWGRGYGTRATRLMLRFAFHTLNLHRVELEVFDFNPRAMRAYEKAGFRPEGTRRESFFQDGRYWDAHRMGILRGEFEEGEG